jgi:GNAT superfamily N-acetyltransferase
MTWAKKVQTDAGSVECFPLTPDRFPDIEEVFGERGTARRCFCMHWRRPDGGFQDTRDNRARFSDITEQGPPPGLVGYLDGRPVGWVQVGPIDDFPTILRSRLFKPVDDTPTWSINCFVVKVGHRRRGIGLGLLTAAVDYAKQCGARVIEAYPVDGDRSSSVDYFTGTMGMFDSHGFVELIRRNDTRPIVRLRVS